MWKTASFGCNAYAMPQRQPKQTFLPATQVASVNAGFDALFAGFIGPLTPLIGTCPPA